MGVSQMRELTEKCENMREKKKREATQWTTPFSANKEASPKGPFSSFGFKTGTCQVQFRKHARFANLECDFLTGPVFF